MKINNSSKRISEFNEYEKKLPEGNEQLRDNNYVGNYNLYQSKYNLLKEHENNEICCSNIINVSSLFSCKFVVVFSA